MKMNGVELRPDSATYTIKRMDGRVILFTMSALPDGVMQFYAERIPLPTVKRLGVVRDRRGKMLRDPNTGELLRETNEASPEYTASLEEAYLRRGVCGVVESLSADPAVTFDTPRPADDAPHAEWVEYANALRAEIRAAGFTTGDLQKLMQFLARLCNLTPEQVSEARADFTPPSQQ